METVMIIWAIGAFFFYSIFCIMVGFYLGHSLSEDQEHKSLTIREYIKKYVHEN